MKDHRYKIHPPTSLRTQYGVQNGTQIRRNQKFIKNDNKELVVKNYPKNKQPIIQQQKFKPPNCHNCKQNTWSKFDKGYYCTNCEYIFNKQRHQIDKKVLRQDRDFSSRLIYANKEIRDIWMNMVNTNYKSTEDMISKLQQLRGKTKLKFYKNLSNYYNEIKNKNFQTQQDTFARNAQGVSKIYHEVLLLMKFPQTKLQVKNMNINYYDLYYTVNKVRDDYKDIDNQYEDDYNDYISLNDVIIPNHYAGKKGREV